jgi:hypothetical protein
LATTRSFTRPAVEAMPPTRPPAVSENTLVMSARSEACRKGQGCVGIPNSDCVCEWKYKEVALGVWW